MPEPGTRSSGLQFIAGASRSTASAATMTSDPSPTSTLKRRRPESAGSPGGRSAHRPALMPAARIRRCPGQSRGAHPRTCATAPCSRRLLGELHRQPGALGQEPHRRIADAEPGTVLGVQLVDGKLNRSGTQSTAARDFDLNQVSVGRCAAAGRCRRAAERERRERLCCRPALSHRPGCARRSCPR